jgi:hypothetical protein
MEPRVSVTTLKKVTMSWTCSSHMELALCTKYWYDSHVKDLEGREPEREALRRMELAPDRAQWRSLFS